MKLLLAGLFAITGTAFAANMAPITYDHATLIARTQLATTMTCSAPGCYDDQAQYMVKSQGILYALTPASGRAGIYAQRATLGWSKVFARTSSLYRLQPGTHILLRDDGRHIFVKVGHRESMYLAIETRQDKPEQTADASF